MNLIIAERVGRTVDEMLNDMSVGELRNWYAHLMLEAEYVEKISKQR